MSNRLSARCTADKAERGSDGQLAVRLGRQHEPCSRWGQAEVPPKDEGLGRRRHVDAEEINGFGGRDRSR